MVQEYWLRRVLQVDRKYNMITGIRDASVKLLIKMAVNDGQLSYSANNIHKKVFFSTSVRSYILNQHVSWSISWLVVAMTPKERGGGGCWSCSTASASSPPPPIWTGYVSACMSRIDIWTLGVQDPLPPSPQPSSPKPQLTPWSSRWWNLLAASLTKTAVGPIYLLECPHPCLTPLSTS